MPPRARTALLTVSGLVIVVLGLFGVVRWLGSGEVLGNVTVSGHDVSLRGLTPTEADEVLAVLELELSVEPVVVQIDDHEVTVLPQQLGLTLHRAAMVEDAMRLGRQGPISDQFRWWLAHLFSTDSVVPQGSLDDEAVEALLKTWDSEVVGVPPVPGGVMLEGVRPVAVYPETGLEIDRTTAPDTLLAAALGPRPANARLVTAVANSRVTRADVDTAVSRAELWLSSPVELVADDVTIEFTVEDMALAFTSTVVDGVVVLGFDPAVIAGFLERNRGDLESPPVDATLAVEGVDVVIVPGSNGTLIDPAATAEALAAAASSVRRQGTLPFVEGAEPEVSTADLEALGVRHLVSEFTTYHPCCQNRVTNIQLMADIIDGAIVLPGETFAVNEYVGERTEARGFLPDGTIVQGELVPTVGGGVSQFATTLYNAVFWGGYEDVTHRPHTFYFSRYPEGIEATISWQQPELAFRNDSDSAVWIRTAYTDTSITVRFYGWNDGRVVVGDHDDGTTEIRVIREGGPEARRVRADVSERSDFTEPSIEYRANPEFEVEQTRRVQSPSQGWTVTVTRSIDQGGQSRQQEWRVRYLARREILEVHPCMVPDAGIACPEPTTTTTTTTFPEETTTTAAG